MWVEQIRYYFGPKMSNQSTQSNQVEPDDPDWVNKTKCNTEISYKFDSNNFYY